MLDFPPSYHKVLAAVEKRRALIDSDTTTHTTTLDDERKWLTILELDVWRKPQDAELHNRYYNLIAKGA